MDRQLAKGLVFTGIGTAGLVAAGFTIANIIKGVNAAEAVAIAGNIKQHLTSLALNSALTVASLIAGLFFTPAGVAELYDYYY